MVKAEKRTRDLIWLRLRGYQVVSLKPGFDEHTIELERTIRKGVPAYPDSTRADFYDVALEAGEAYIHVYRGGHTIYLVAHSISARSQFCPFSASSMAAAI
jgi:hypothetical protein